MNLKIANDFAINNYCAKPSVLFFLLTDNEYVFVCWLLIFHLTNTWTQLNCAMAL